MLAMKKLILILAVVAFATTAWAQETPKKPSFAGFVSNGFWDNWEMSLGGGVGTALTNGSNSGSFGKRLGFEANFSLVKWVHPVVCPAKTPLTSGASRCRKKPIRSCGDAF